MELENGMSLRLLSAFEVLQARREAGELVREDRERAVCANACLLARALEHGGKPVFDSGLAVLEGLTVAEIAALSQQWREFDRTENPALNLGEQELEILKKTDLRPPAASALAGDARLWRTAHRGARPEHEGRGLCVVSGEPAAGRRGGAGTAVPRLPEQSHGAALCPVRRGAGGVRGGRERRL